MSFGSTAIRLGLLLWVLSTVAHLRAAEPSLAPPMLATPELVSEMNCQWLEGARWDAARARLLFTDVYGETLYALTTNNGVSVVRTPTGKANHLEFDPQGRLVSCEITGRVSRLTLTNGAITDAVTDYAGHMLAFPNDLVILANGTIYFSDTKAAKIFRIDPAGKLHAALPKDSAYAGANGLALSPDQKTLYATYTHAGLIRAFDITVTDHVTGPHVVAQTEKLPDGLCVDSSGNLYVGTATGVQVFSKAGQGLGVLTLPGLRPKDRVTKCVFGGTDGRTLFVLVPGKLFRVPAKIAGWTAPQPDSR